MAIGTVAVPEQRQILTRLHRVNVRSLYPRPFRSRPSRLTFAAAAGTVVAASAAATGLVLIPADSSRPLPAAADSSRFTVIGSLSRASSQSTAGPTAREVHQLLARTQAAHRALITRRQAAAVRAAERRAAAQAAAAQAQREQAQRRQAAQKQPVKQQTAPATSSGAPSAPSGSPQQIAISMLAQFGWGTSEFSCLNPLWERESGWNPYAANPSGAYGIPQALPGAKMASAGPDWASDAATQIRWGLGYIRATYGSPCAAWSHETSYGWY